MEVIFRNYDIRNMRCQDGNAKTAQLLAAGRPRNTICKSCLSAHLEIFNFLMTAEFSAFTNLKSFFF